MFEKVVAGRAERRSCFGRHGASVAVAAHVLFVAGIVAAPQGMEPRVPPDTATMLLLYQPPSPRLPPLLPREVRPPARTRGLLRAATLRQAAPAPEAERPRDQVEPLLRPPPVMAVVDPASPQALDLLRLRGVGRAGTVADGGASQPGSAGSQGAPLIDAEILAEPPRMVNRGEIATVLGRLYPYRFRVRGLQGEVVMMFIIGTDGRAELGSVQVLSATDPGFVEPTLEGLRRMRFSPAELDGVRVRVRATLPVTWMLGES